MKSAGGHSATVVWERGVFKGSPVGGAGVLCYAPPGGSRIVPTGLHSQDAGHTLVISPVSSSFFVYLCFFLLVPPPFSSLPAQTARSVIFSVNTSESSTALTKLLYMSAGPLEVDLSPARFS